MERKIGEIFEYNGEWYQCVESDNCGECSLFTTECGSGTKSDLADKVFGQCSKVRRIGNKYVIFKKLEKVGRPYEFDGHLFQSYRIFEVPIFTENYATIRELGNNSLISIEIKQNKEDMEEKKIQLKQEDIDYLTRKIRYLVYKNNDYDRATEEIMNLFIPSDTEHSSSEKIGKNLKPFDLEAAKAGKPVYTRDGHKARIICFDKQEGFPIIALVETKVNDRISEEIALFNINGRAVSDDIDSKLDLMMLPEKKEGWVNVVRGSNGSPHMGRGIFQSKEEAENAIKAFSDNLIDTVKISWKE